MRLGEDTGLVERMLGIADRFDDALLVDFAAGFDVHFGRPMLRIVGVEPRVRDDLDLGGEPGHVGIRLRRAAIDIVETLRVQRGKRDLMGDADHGRLPRAGLGAGRDHAGIGRRHAHPHLADRFGTHAAIEDGAKRFDGGDALLGRAERLQAERGIDAARAEFFGQPLAIERDAVAIGEPGLVQNIRIAAIIRARRLGRGDAGGHRIGIEKPAPRRRAVDAADAAGHQHHGERQSVAGARLGQSHEPRRRCRRRDRRGEISRPDAAIKNLRPAHRDADPGHDLGADPDRACDFAWIEFLLPRREHQRHRNDAGARRGA